MKYFIFLFSIVAWGALGLIIGKGVAGTWREESNADKKARILNDPDIQTVPTVLRNEKTALKMR